jgi:hypothetical protein
MLKGILAISGQSGLFKKVAEGKNHIIAESLLTGKRMPVHSSSKVSSLEDIAIFTDSGEKPLKEVLKKIFDHENGGKTIDHKSPDPELKKYFTLVVPDYDQDKVYVSDMKKVVLWYNILHDKELLDFTEEEEASSPEDTAKEPDNSSDEGNGSTEN